jgi:Pretoxin HINT domain
MKTRTPKLLGWILVVGLLVAAWLPSSQQRATETASGQLSRAQLSPVSASERSLSLPESRKLASSSESFQAIETLRVGQRVLTGLASDANRTTAVDSTSWKKLSLKADYAWVDGTRDAFIVETLQPPEFLVHHSAEVGSRVPMPLDVQEMGCPDGLMAVVESIEPCPAIQDSDGRVVLTTVNHLNTACRALTVRDHSGNTETIQTTDYHPFWSETHQDWVQAGKLAVGENLRGLNLHNELVVIDSQRIAGAHLVFNMTVESEHVYRVGWNSILVHNADCRDFAMAVQKKEGGAVIEILPGQGPSGQYPKVSTPPKYPIKGQPDPPFDNHVIHMKNGVVKDPAYPQGIAVEEWLEAWAKEHSLTPSDMFIDHRFMPVLPKK